MLNRRPSVGLALGIVGERGIEHFRAHGLADIATRVPISEDTVFRIASITKTFTAVAVMQLWERGLLDLDAPASDYLRAYKLEPGKPKFRPATIRHLLTHTAGIREVLRPSGLLRMRDLGETVPAGGHVPTLAEFYGGRLRFDAEPGTRFIYTNHGFATLGQIVEDVSGMTLGRYFREYIFVPLGMASTDLVRTEAIRSRLATAYELRSGGPKAIPDYELVPVGAGGAYSTPRDMALYLVALMRGGANDRGRVLSPATTAMLFEPQYRPDSRLSGIGMAFFRQDLGGHLAVEHDGILPGFDSQIFVAPHDGLAVMAFANGAAGGLHWLTPEAAAIMRRLLGVPDDTIRGDVPHHPEIWGELCGWYQLPLMLDIESLATGPGVEVFVRHGRLTARALSPVPALYHGFELHPDDETDPYVFRIDLSGVGLGTSRVVFSRQPPALHLDFGPVSFHKGPDSSNPRRWVMRAAGLVGAAAAVTALAGMWRSTHRTRTRVP